MHTAPVTDVIYVGNASDISSRPWHCSVWKPKVLGSPSRKSLKLTPFPIWPDSALPHPFLRTPLAFATAMTTGRWLHVSCLRHGSDSYVISTKHPLGLN